jgi:methyl coenzyme M reductase subunit D
MVSNIPSDMDFKIFPLMLLVERYPIVKLINSIPKESSGTFVRALIKGQAIPSKPSGKPRLIKAR